MKKSHEMVTEKSRNVCRKVTKCLPKSHEMFAERIEATDGVLTLLQWAEGKNHAQVPAAADRRLLYSLLILHFILSFPSQPILPHIFLPPLRRPATNKATALYILGLFLTFLIPQPPCIKVVTSTKPVLEQDTNTGKCVSKEKRDFMRRQS